MENQRSVVLGIIVLLVAGFFLGYYHGKQDGWREATPKIEKVERKCKELEEKLKNTPTPPISPASPVMPPKAKQIKV